MYISAALAPSGTSAQLLQRWRFRQFDLNVSAKLIDELARTLRRDRFRTYIALADVDDLVDQLRRRAVFVQDPADVTAVSRDPNDDDSIALAIEASADANALDPPPPAFHARGPSVGPQRRTPRADRSPMTARHPLA